MGRQVDPIERAQRVTAELREATAEAAGELRDLLRAIKTAREVVATLAPQQVAASVLPHVETMRTMVTDAVHTAQVAITDDFNATSERLTALLMDLEKRGRVYQLGMPAVEGVKAVDALIDEVMRRSK